MSLTYAAQEKTSSLRQSSTIVAVVLLHIGFLYAFTHGMSVSNIMQPITKTVAVLIADPPKPQEPPPVVKPDPAQIPVNKLVAELPLLPPILEPQVDNVVSQQTDLPPTGVAAEEPQVTPPPMRSIAIKYRVEPLYPSASRRAGESGTVLLNVVVAPDGVPTDVNVERSSGFAALDEAALVAVRKWRFAVNAESSYSRVRLPITFRLETTH